MNLKRIGITATLFLIMVAMVAAPAAAYTVAPSGGTSKPCNGWGLNNFAANNIVQLCFTKSETSSLFYFPGYAADVVLQVAKQKGMNVQRTKASVETEIRGHAALMMAPNVLVPRGGAWRWTYEIASPMDIEMYKTESWVYWLD
jgi:hypothetical protein